MGGMIEDGTMSDGFLLSANCMRAVHSHHGQPGGEGGTF